MSAVPPGALHIVGVGPGDPELMTLKAARVLGEAACYAFFAKRGRPGHAVSIARAHLRSDAEALRFEYPFTTELPPEHELYRGAMTEFYDAAGDTLAVRLDAGAHVALLCEGDPFFYGSSMYLFDRLRDRHRCEIVSGVLGMTGCWGSAGLPMTHGDDVMTILPGTLGQDDLARRLSGSDAAVIMKVGRNLPKIREALRTAGRDDAMYVERGSMAGERVTRLADLDPDELAAAPYFSLILIPGRRRPR
jgi:precorrin-2/cobalt-factor-2 C20-methyltransferase